VQVLAQQAGLVEGGVPAYAGVDHAHLGVAAGAQPSLEQRREVLFIGDLATSGVAVAEDHDAKLTGRFGYRHVRTDQAARVRDQHLVVLRRPQSHAQVWAHGVARLGIELEQPFLASEDDTAPGAARFAQA
jgi:hypothetical protein